MVTASPDVPPTGPDPRFRRRSDRLLAILSLLDEHDVVRLRQFVRQLAVSEATVRRDLSDLEEQGMLTRTHGGARRSAPATELPMRLRAGQSHHVKQLIARRAATFLPQGPCTVALGGGTTAAGVARELLYRNGLTVITNSLSTAAEMGSRPNLRVVMTGGTVRPNSLELVGLLAESAFASVTVDLAILGADGVSAEGGVTTYDEREARTNAVMVRHSRRAVVVADSTKIGRSTPAGVTGLGDIGDLVTDSGASCEELRRIRALGTRVHVVGAGSLADRG
ncbi:DeoR/GlpR family DNA-binding transcription regulator [Kineococcus radiotolerans]|uniref:DeoR/GlpR family DNA-binding transcription regulator n=1 Tax=Kineococcus radiotolerans TaxID=131568 RepID=UPI00003A3D94|nr:DeoR/GlpR family DNA-binding transcription regulator [Kineococcus radiotolerans]